MILKICRNVKALLFWNTKACPALCTAPYLVHRGNHSNYLKYKLNFKNARSAV